MPPPWSAHQPACLRKCGDDDGCDEGKEDKNADDDNENEKSDADDENGNDDYDENVDDPNDNLILAANGDKYENVAKESEDKCCRINHKR